MNRTSQSKAEQSMLIPWSIHRCKVLDLALKFFLNGWEKLIFLVVWKEDTQLYFYGNGKGSLSAIWQPCTPKKRPSQKSNLSSSWKKKPYSLEFNTDLGSMLTTISGSQSGIWLTATWKWYFYSGTSLFIALLSPREIDITTSQKESFDRVFFGSSVPVPATLFSLLIRNKDQLANQTWPLK